MNLERNGAWVCKDPSFLRFISSPECHLVASRRPHSRSSLFGDELLHSCARTRIESSNKFRNFEDDCAIEAWKEKGKRKEKEMKIIDNGIIKTRKRERERGGAVYSIIDRTIWIRDFLFSGRKSIVNRGREGTRRSSWIQNINQVLGEDRARKIFGNYDKPLSIVWRPPRQSPSSRLSFENGDFGDSLIFHDASFLNLVQSNGNDSNRAVKRIKTRSEERNLEESGKINNNRNEGGKGRWIYIYIHRVGEKRENSFPRNFVVDRGILRVQPVGGHFLFHASSGRVPFEVRKSTFQRARGRGAL